MMKKLCFIAVGILVLGFNTGFAQDKSEDLEMQVSIPKQSGLEIKTFKVTGKTWAPAGGLEFSNLTFNQETGVITSDSYYVIEVGINSNAENWSINHGTKSISNQDSNLDNNINVSFVKQKDADNGDLIEKVSFADSNNKSISKTQLGGGWLRVYYGLATGKDDAPGVSPLTSSKTSGKYSGEVHITLTE
ncbi:MAG: hypothetical protein PHE58_01725 [Candidatus Omnitrophica bacterium]|nr:hypothetical protein [Candidatus Omnitrophota bacterium]